MRTLFQTTDISISAQPESRYFLGAGYPSPRLKPGASRPFLVRLKSSSDALGVGVDDSMAGAADLAGEAAGAHALNDRAATAIVAAMSNLFMVSSLAGIVGLLSVRCGNEHHAGEHFGGHLFVV